MSRPWSSAEIEDKIPELVERMETALEDLHELGARAAHAEWHYRKLHATALVSSTARNREQREAEATLAAHDAGLARSLAENAYANQRQVIRALEAELRVLQTLHVSGRQVP